MPSSTLPSTVTSRAILIPPSSPSNTAKYIVPASGATGAWAGYGNQITWYENGAWAYAIPPVGLSVFVNDEKNECIFDGSTWDSPLSNVPPANSPAFSGIPTAPTAALNTNTSQIATTSFVINQDAFLAPLANPTFTGTVTAPSFSGSFTGTYSGTAVNLTPGTVTDSYTIQNLGTLTAQTSVSQSSGRYIRMTLGANITVVLNNGISTTATEKVIFEISQDATGSRTIYWASQHGYPFGITPTLSTAPNSVDILEFTWNGTFWMVTNFNLSIVTASTIVYGLRPQTYTLTTDYFTAKINPTYAYDSGVSTTVDSSTYAQFNTGAATGGWDCVTYSGFIGPAKTGTLYINQIQTVGSGGGVSGSGAIDYSLNSGSTWTNLATAPSSGILSVILTNQNPTQLQVRIRHNTGYTGSASASTTLYDIVFI